VGRAVETEEEGWAAVTGVVGLVEVDLAEEKVADSVAAG